MALYSFLYSVDLNKGFPFVIIFVAIFPSYIYAKSLSRLFSAFLFSSVWHHISIKLFSLYFSQYVHNTSPLSDCYQLFLPRLSHDLSMVFSKLVSRSIFRLLQVFFFYSFAVQFPIFNCYIRGYTPFSIPECLYFFNDIFYHIIPRLGSENHFHYFSWLPRFYVIHSNICGCSGNGYEFL